jgi:phosphatidylglycerophosphate synthase
MYRALPDALSLLRIPCAISVTVLYSGREKWRFEAAVGVIAIALATDFLDGAIARKYCLTSEHGYILDGLGDRAMYIGLFLAFLVEHKIGLVATWLLIFREVAIYAVRLFSGRWFSANQSVRFLSLLHAGLVRMWILCIIVADGLVLFADSGQFMLKWLAFASTGLLLATLIVAYYSLISHMLAILATTDL